MAAREVVVVSGARTAIGDYGASLKDVPATQLGTIAIREAVARAGIDVATVGHVVLGRDAIALDETRDHERVHVAQCERWGAAFVPAYLAASAMAWARGGDAYRDNPFERDAWARAPVPDGLASTGSRADAAL